MVDLRGVIQYIVMSEKIQVILAREKLFGGRDNFCILDESSCDSLVHYCKICHKHEFCFNFAFGSGASAKNMCMECFSESFEQQKQTTVIKNDHIKKGNF